MIDEVTKQRFHDIVVECSKAITAEAKVKINCDSKIIYECYDRAEITLLLYKLDEDGRNHFKVYGHFCYWLRKLKPLSVVKESDEKISHEKLSYMNEYLAFIVALNAIQFSQKVYIKSKLDKLPRQELDKISRNYKVVDERLGSLVENVIKSLRYQVHSSGSIATLLECTLFCGTEDHFI